MRDIDGKSVCVLGLGKEGHAALEALKTYAPRATVSVRDKNPKARIDGYDCIAGDGYLDDLDRFDVIIKSPGIPPHPKLTAAEQKLTDGTNIFLETALAAGAVTVGVTGSKGKSTTSSLIFSILKSRWTDVHLVGNIGEPALAHLDKITEGVRLVLELSSYQLMLCKRSPHIAVLTSFFPEHLDYHGSLEAYKDAKANIARHQTADDVVFFAQGYPDLKDMAELSPGMRRCVTMNEAPLALEETALIGAHNLENMALAAAVARHLGIDDDAIRSACRSFIPLPHRLQSLGMHHGIRWIDDAISTTPQSAIAALEALKGETDCIILGGQDRGIDFSPLGSYVAESSVSTVILFPDTGAKIRGATEAAGGTQRFFDASSMEEAVSIARRETSPGKICLLSTASPSYNMFKNFEDKGDQFARCVLASA